MRVPTEFRYFDRVGRPGVRGLRTAVQWATGVDPAPRPEVAEAFAAAYFDGDPVADAFALEASTARRLLDVALTKGLDAVASPPEALTRLVRDCEAAPPWLDRAQLGIGARAFRRYGTTVFRFAGAITAAAYRESSVAKPLALTGAYAGASARRRFLETASFWIDVSEPGGLERFGAGFVAAVRVRVMHAMIRRRLRAHAEWNEAAWGVPISQGDALLTLLGGSLAPGLALRVLGYRPTRGDIEAMLHFWRYVGHVMGVRPVCFPETLTEALQLSFAAMLKNADRAGEDGLALGRGYALAFAPSERAGWRARLEHAEHLGMTRLFMTGRAYREAAIPPAGAGVLLPLARAPWVALAETARRHVPALDAIADARARRERSAWLARHLEGEKAAYRPVDHLTR